MKKHFFAKNLFFTKASQENVSSAKIHKFKWKKSGNTIGYGSVVSLGIHDWDIKYELSHVTRFFSYNIFLITPLNSQSRDLYPYIKDKLQQLLIKACG